MRLRVLLQAQISLQAPPLVPTPELTPVLILVVVLLLFQVLLLLDAAVYAANDSTVDPIQQAAVFKAVDATQYSAIYLSLYATQCVSVDAAVISKKRHTPSMQPSVKSKVALDYGYHSAQGRSRCISSPRRFDANRPLAVLLLGQSVRKETRERENCEKRDERTGEL